MNITSHYSTTIKKLSHYSKTEQIQTATIDTLLLYYQAIILLWKKAYRSLCYYTSTVLFMYTKEGHRSSSLTSQYFEGPRSSALTSLYFGGQSRTTNY